MPEAPPAAPSEVLDRIYLTDHVREVEIGAFQTERGVVQRVRFHVSAEVSTRAEAAADDVDRILSYDTLTDAISAEVAAGRVDLLETLAARISARVLVHPMAESCTVRIEKLDRGPFALGVEITRTAAAAGAEIAPPRPAVACLSWPAVLRDDIAAMLDALPRPAILTVGFPPQPRPMAAHPLAQRRIDLLALEQAAWVLAARDPRCVVVETRTELDWALRQGQVVVWAPSKLVLDAADPPPVAQPALARWLADQFDAGEVLAIDAGQDHEAAVP